MQQIGVYNAPESVNGESRAGGRTRRDSNRVSSIQAIFFAYKTIAYNRSETAPPRLIQSTDRIDKIHTVENCALIGNIPATGREIDRKHPRGKIFMSDGEVDLGRRRLLTVATAVTGGVGAAALAAPFVMSFKPSARAKAVGAPVKVNIERLEIGSLMRIMWRGKVVYLVKRSEEAMATLARVTPKLDDPDSTKSKQPTYAQNAERSKEGELLVLVAVCTHLGCAPAYRPEVGAPGADQELVGFLCACHGSHFDISGRVFKAQPAATNLEVPPYRMLGDGWLLIGDDTGADS